MLKLISIHAPREGSDSRPARPKPKSKEISIHAPREGSDRCSLVADVIGIPFLSTLPARGATLPPWILFSTSPIISIHAPREGSDAQTVLFPFLEGVISIHAPREGSDPTGSKIRPWRPAFLSTLPARGATSTCEASTGSLIFLSTLPARGATANAGKTAANTYEFLSTLPARGATKELGKFDEEAQFLSTLPARGATSIIQMAPRPHSNFYPRSPRGERLNQLKRNSSHFNFYPRSPRGERPAT